MSTLQKARQIGVNGYVRNLSNGKVEIVVLGKADRVEELLKWTKSGPPSAIVNNLELEILINDGEEFQGFEIRR